MDHVVWLPFLFLIFIMVFCTRRVTCPDCGDRMPQFYAPAAKTRRMWRAGGYLCARCGCETDTAGRKVTADTPLPPFPTRHLAAVAVALAIGVGLAVAMFITAAQEPAAPAVAAPAVVPEE